MKITNDFLNCFKRQMNLSDEELNDLKELLLDPNKKTFEFHNVVFEKLENGEIYTLQGRFEPSSKM